MSYHLILSCHLYRLALSISCHCTLSCHFTLPLPWRITIPCPYHTRLPHPPYNTLPSMLYRFTLPCHTTILYACLINLDSPCPLTLIHYHKDMSTSKSLDQWILFFERTFLTVLLDQSR